MRISIVPRYFFDRLKKEHKDSFDECLENHIIISIFGFDEKSPFDNMTHENLLSLQFDDITYEMDDFPKMILFNKEHGNMIIDFINNIRHEFPIIVHCNAGISRSGAVGEFINDYVNRYKHDNKIDWKLNILEFGNYILPNVHVKSILNMIMAERKR